MEGLHTSVVSHQMQVEHMTESSPTFYHCAMPPTNTSIFTYLFVVASWCESRHS